MRDFFTSLARDTRGATAIEYGLIISLVILAIMASMQLMATNIINVWNDIASKVIG